jgi:hypothetical protein
MIYLLCVISGLGQLLYREWLKPLSEKRTQETWDLLLFRSTGNV